MFAERYRIIRINSLKLNNSKIMLKILYIQHISNLYIYILNIKTIKIIPLYKIKTVANACSFHRSFSIPIPQKSIPRQSNVVSNKRSIKSDKFPGDCDCPIYLHQSDKMDTATVKRPIHRRYNIRSFMYYTLERNHGVKRVKPQEGRNRNSKFSQKMIYASLCMHQCINVCMHVRVYSICISTE